MVLGSKDNFKVYKNGIKGALEIDDATLHKLQHFLLDILCELDEVFKRNNVEYSLSGGSVLGAVRHQGFIPWDDDLDLNMTRANYEKMKLIFDKELGNKYILCAPELGNKHGMACVQIKKKGTQYASFNELSKADSMIGIDIFVMENVPNNSLLRKLYGYLCLASGYLLTCRKTCEDFDLIVPYVESQELLKIMKRKKRIGKLFSFISLDNIAKFTNKIYSLCKNNESTHISIMSGKKHYFGEMFLREDLARFTNKKFADQEFMIPQNYDVYLKRLYGNDYMVEPPVADREVHPIYKLDFGKENER